MTFIHPKPPVDPTIEATLLKNGFKNYPDWEFGPVSGWPNDHDHMSLQLMRHAFGYWLILRSHSSGENKTMNMGSSNSAEDIIAIRDLLKRLW